VNVTVIEQAPPAPMLVPHNVADTVKFALGVAVKLVKLTEAVPESVRVNVCAALVTLTALEKVSVLLLRVEPVMVTAGLPVGPVGLVLLEPPPQPAITANPTTIARKRLSVAVEKVFALIAPPPA
jgi:hypothetical protein